MVKPDLGGQVNFKSFVSSGRVAAHLPSPPTHGLSVLIRMNRQPCCI